MPTKKKKSDPTDDPRFLGAYDLIGRTGAKSIEVRFSEPEAEEGKEVTPQDGPVIWMAIGEWEREGRRVFDVGASTNVLVALFRLLDQVIDGGICQYCHRPTGFEESMDQMPLDRLVCWYQWDPERKKFRRGCEGDDK